MSRKIILCLLTTALLPTFRLVGAQQPKKVPRIGYLAPFSSRLSSFTEAFQQGLRELGYTEGQNILIEYRWAEGKVKKLPSLAAELIKLRVDVIVAAGTKAIEAAKEATKIIPVVMAISGDPVGTGLVASLARPGGNITGLSHMSPDAGGKRLELLKEAVPRISRVGVLWNSAHPVKVLEWREIEGAARAFAVTLQSLEVRGPADFDSIFALMTKQRHDALVTFEDPLTLAHRKRIVEFAAKNRLPSMYEAREFVEAGGLIGYGPNFPDLYRRAATYVDKILKGAKPADLLVEQPTKFEFVINLKTAKQIGVTISPEILMRAKKVIK